MKVPQMWIAVPATGEDVRLLQRGYPMKWCMGRGCARGDLVFFHIIEGVAQATDYFCNITSGENDGLLFVYKVEQLSFSTLCADRGLDTAELAYVAQLETPIGSVEMSDHPVLGKMPAVFQGFHGSIFLVPEEEERNVLLEMAMARSINLKGRLEDDLI